MSEDARTATFANTIRDIRDDAFSWADVLLSVEMNEGLETLDAPEESPRGIFSGTGIRSVAIPSTLRVIGESTFHGCEELERVWVPERSALEEIGCSCFSKSAVRELVVPRNVTRMGRSAFRGCGSLRRVTF